MSKKLKLLCATLCVISLIFGGYIFLNYENEQKYTYEELSSLPADQLLDLFIENGLVIDEQLNETFTEKELQELFYGNFHFCTRDFRQSEAM